MLLNNCKCKCMSAGDKYIYKWNDTTKLLNLSAPEYIASLMIWIKGIIDNESIFPTKPNIPFEDNFINYINDIYKRLFRVYAHIYYHHFEYFINIHAEPHLNTCFKHFMYFVKEFNLIQDEKQLEPLIDLINKLVT